MNDRIKSLGQGLTFAFNKISDACRRLVYSHQLSDLKARYKDQPIPIDVLKKTVGCETSFQIREETIKLLGVLEKINKHFCLKSESSIVYMSLVAFYKGTLKHPDTYTRVAMDVCHPDNKVKLYERMVEIGDISKAHLALYPIPEEYSSVREWIRSL